MLKKYLFHGLLPLLLAGVFTITWNQANGQIYFGAKAGPSFANVNGDFPGNNFKLGFSGGGTIGYSFGDDGQFNIQTDLLVTLKGLNQKFTEKSSLEQNNILTETTLKYDNKLHLTYFEAPLTFKYSLSLGGGVFPYHGENGPVNIDIMAGPYFGYLLNASASFNTTRKTRVAFYDDEGNVKNEQVKSSSIDGGKFRLKNRAKYGLKPYAGLDSFKDVNIPSTLNGTLNNMDIGVTAGIGISFEISDNSTLGIEGRYTKGFFNIDDTFFNDYDVKAGVTNNQITYEVTANKADLTNAAFVGYVSWTYQLSSSTF